MHNGRRWCDSTIPERLSWSGTFFHTLVQTHSDGPGQCYCCAHAMQERMGKTPRLRLGARALQVHLRSSCDHRDCSHNHHRRARDTHLSPVHHGGTPLQDTKFTVAILAQGTSWAVAVTQAFLCRGSNLRSCKRRPQPGAVADADPCAHHCIMARSAKVYSLPAPKVAKKLFTLLDLCVSSLRRGHANLLCIVPILTDDPRRESNSPRPRFCHLTLGGVFHHG